MSFPGGGNGGHDAGWRPDAWGGPTDWTVVAGAARGRSEETSAQAWSALLERYRRPVRLAVRRRLALDSAADDVADAFFTYLYTGDVLARARQEQGRFRCFLQGVLRRYLAQRRAEQVRFRGEPLRVEEAAPVEVPPEVERAEEAEWASQVLDNALAALRRESPRGAELLLRVHGIAPYPTTTAAALAAELAMSANALHQALFRARRRLRELVLAEIRSTVGSEPDCAVETKVIVARLLEAWSHVFAEGGE